MLDLSDWGTRRTDGGSADAVRGEDTGRDAFCERSGCDACRTLERRMAEEPVTRKKFPRYEEDGQNAGMLCVRCDRKWDDHYNFACPDEPGANQPSVYKKSKNRFTGPSLSEARQAEKLKVPADTLYVKPEDLETAREALAASEGEAARKFATGATRSSDSGRDDPEGYLSPLVIDRFNEYMTKHRVQADGRVRDSDNWQKGMPLATYMKGLWRHVLHLWTRHRGFPVRDPGAAANLEEDLCAIIFNAQGYLHETVKARLAKESGDATR